MERMATVSSLPKGRNFTRCAIALMRAKGRWLEAADIAREAWPDSPAVPLAVKAAVGAGSTSDATWASALVQYQNMASEFVELLRPATILGRLTGIRRVPFVIRFPKQTGGAACTWIGEGIPLVAQALVYESDSLG